jgi:hypothetical protein
MLELIPGTKPWQVGQVMHVFNRFDHPTSGLMRIGDEEVSFRCLAGIGEEESLWAYVTRPAGIIVDAYTPRHIFEQWADVSSITFALADEKGIIRSRHAAAAKDVPYEKLVDLAAEVLMLGESDLQAIGL